MSQFFVDPTEKWTRPVFAPGFPDSSESNFCECIEMECIEMEISASNISKRLNDENWLIF